MAPQTRKTLTPIAGEGLSYLWNMQSESNARRGDAGAPPRGSPWLLARRSLNEPTSAKQVRVAQSPRNRSKFVGGPASNAVFCDRCMAASIARWRIGIRTSPVTERCEFHDAKRRYSQWFEDLPARLLGRIQPQSIVWCGRMEGLRRVGLSVRHLRGVVPGGGCCRDWRAVLG